MTLRPRVVIGIAGIVAMVAQRAWAVDNTPPAACAMASFPTPSKVEYVNNCGFRVVFVTTCAVGASQCYGKGLQTVEPHSRAQAELSGGPYRISQAQRAD